MRRLGGLVVTVTTGHFYFVADPSGNAIFGVTVGQPAGEIACYENIFWILFFVACRFEFKPV
jgi:hypothetical protein